MTASGARRSILKKLRVDNQSQNLQNISLVNKPPLPDDIYQTEDDIPEIIFANQLKSMAGKFVFAENTKELIEQLKSIFHKEKWEGIYCIDNSLIKIFKNSGIKFTTSQGDFKRMKAGMTACENLVARFGSVVISSKQRSGRSMNIFPPVHIVIAYTSQIVMEPEEALENIKNKYKNNIPSLISVITGPSRTADIEKTLVMGAHGPKDLYVFLVKD